MDYPNHTTNSRKHKYLTCEQHMIFQIRVKDGFSPYKMAKELEHASNTIRNEIARGTVAQIKQGCKVCVYLADSGQCAYLNNHKFCCPKFKRLSCANFLHYVHDRITNYKWSLDACVGYAYTS